jgi:hypothetical protein
MYEHIYVCTKLRLPNVDIIINEHIPTCCFVNDSRLLKQSSPIL